MTMERITRTDVEKFLKSTLNSKGSGDLLLNSNANLFTSGALDSFGLMEVILMLEEKFNVSIPAEMFDDRRFQEIRTLPDVIVDLYYDR